MTSETLQKAKDIEGELREIGAFLHYCESNYYIRFFKKKRGIAVTVSDYMRETKLFELSREQRQKFILMLKEEYESKKKELEQLK